MANGVFAQKKPDSCAFVIFGVTGDLTHRLVMPSLYNLGEVLRGRRRPPGYVE
jgi:glucose-6-phosphate 1-dehydrogenase